MGVVMEMTALGGARGHEFFDDAELGRFDEMPAVAVRALRASPFVVFCGFGADDVGHALLPWFEDIC